MVGVKNYLDLGCNTFRRVTNGWGVENLNIGERSSIEKPLMKIKTKSNIANCCRLLQRPDDLMAILSLPASFFIHFVLLLLSIELYQSLYSIELIQDLSISSGLVLNYKQLVYWKSQCLNQQNR